jgi:hypothetical protein
MRGRGTGGVRKDIRRSGLASSRTSAVCKDCRVQRRATDLVLLVAGAEPP